MRRYFKPAKTCKKQTHTPCQRCKRDRAPWFRNPAPAPASRRLPLGSHRCGNGLCVFSPHIFASIPSEHIKHSAGLEGVLKRHINGTIKSIHSAIFVYHYVRDLSMGIRLYKWFITESHCFNMPPLTPPSPLGPRLFLPLRRARRGAPGRPVQDRLRDKPRSSKRIQEFPALERMMAFLRVSFFQ